MRPPSRENDFHIELGEVDRELGQLLWSAAPVSEFDDDVSSIRVRPNVPNDVGGPNGIRTLVWSRSRFRQQYQILLRPRSTRRRPPGGFRSSGQSRRGNEPTARQELNGLVI